MKYRLLVITLVILCTASLWGQGTYYNSLSPSNSTFVSDLKSRIRLPYTHVSYDGYKTSYIPNFAARDTTAGRKVVTCVYSGLNYVYTPPFAWIGNAGVNSDSGLSREHTWCHNWMPTNPANSPERDEYSDQHHLFPTNQNFANVVRSDHPLGNVVTVTSTYLNSKYGKNADNQNVYEPRAEHKGDAARALLYMAVRYDSINGYRWTFDSLQSRMVWKAKEAPQDLQLLLDWHKQDPPNKWEVDRNNYIESIQGNRNPFVDHPEYVNYINFSSLTKLNPTYSTEPANQPTSPSVSSITSSSFSVSWAAAVTGSQAPSGYLIQIYNSNDYFIPIDGLVYSDDTDISDSKGLVNVTSSTSYSFSGLTAGTQYYIRIYSFNGSGTSINYKIDGTVATTTGTTSGAVLADEPTNYPNGYSSTTITSNSIKLEWNDPGGAVLPTGYLIKASTTNSFTDPVSGNVYSDQTNLSGGSAEVNVSYGTGQYTFSSLPSSTSFYFKLYPYNGNTTSRMYKTESYPSALEGNFTTSSNASPTPTDLFFSEYIEGSSNNKALEIYNGTGNAINLATGSYNIEIYYNGSATAGSTIMLSGTIANGGTFVICNTSASASITSVAQMTSGNINFNGDDAVVLKKGSTILDVIGVVGTDPGTEWGSGLTSTADNTLVRKSTIYSGDTNPSDAFDPSVEWNGFAADTFGYLGSHSGPILPVELTSFSASHKENRIELIWKTATETNNYGFDIERKNISNASPQHNWTRIGFVEGHGTTNSPKEYLFTDNTVYAGKYTYRLKQIDRDGAFEYSSVVLAEVPVSVPSRLILEQNFPNPFNPVTSLKFYVPVSSQTTLTVYNAIGQKSALLFNEYAERGKYYHVDFQAHNLASGVYVAYLKSGSESKMIRMTLLK